MNSQKCILVVDDHPFARLGVTVSLERAGFQIYEADNEQTAWETAKSTLFDGAVLDIDIFDRPGDQKRLDHYGLSLGNKLKETFPQIGIVFLSAYTEYIPDVWNMVYQGKRGLAYQHKGNTKEQLLNALNKAMAGELIIEANVMPDIDPLREGLVASLTPEEKVWVEIICTKLEGNVLSKRETEVANLLAASRTREGIRLSLVIELSSVDNHIAKVWQKLGIENIEKTMRKEVLLAKAFNLIQLRRYSTSS